MKKSILALTALTLTLSAFTPKSVTTENKKKITTSGQMAEYIVAALQNSSSEDYLELFPSLIEFQDVMKANSELYGKYLSDAQREFAANYKANLLPAVKRSFDGLIKEGEEKGIEWKSVRLIGVQLNEETQQRFNSLPVTITVSSKGVEHQLKIEKALVINGEWRISQFVALD
jgi:hypothetical protein